MFGGQDEMKRQILTVAFVSLLAFATATTTWSQGGGGGGGGGGAGGGAAGSVAGTGGAAGTGAGTGGAAGTGSGIGGGTMNTAARGPRNPGVGATAPNPGGGGGGAGFAGTTGQSPEKEHPEWFHSNRPYRPCPSSVRSPKGGNARLGCPTACGTHF
jgi:hypothetical protein